MHPYVVRVDNHFFPKQNPAKIDLLSENPSVLFTIKNSNSIHQMAALHLPHWARQGCGSRLHQWSIHKVRGNLVKWEGNWTLTNSNNMASSCQSPVGCQAPPKGQQQKKKRTHEVKEGGWQDIWSGETKAFISVVWQWCWCHDLHAVPAQSACSHADTTSQSIITVLNCTVILNEFAITNNKNCGFCLIGILIGHFHAFIESTKLGFFADNLKFWRTT